MPTNELLPISETPKSILPKKGNFASVTADAVPYGLYLNSPEWVSGAVDQVALTYKLLGGDVLDIELDECQVYAAYELATLEYSYLINIHQAKNVLSDFLGFPTGTFDHNGEITNSLSGTNIQLSYPGFTFSYSKRIATGIADRASLNGTTRVYSASIDTEVNQQEYDLQSIVSSSAASGAEYSDAFNDSGQKKVRIHRVYFKSPASMWRFYGYYGGLTVVGNLNTYGQYSDDSTFELVPAWQNKLQALAYETNLYTRASHYSYELRNNRIKLYPPPTTGTPRKVWFEFSVESSPWEETEEQKIGISGINNLNTIPFANIPYENINSMGKQWIRNYAMALTKEMLAQIRGKFTTIPIPGESVTLNWSELLNQAATEKEKLRDELKTYLDELTYSAMVEADAELAENSSRLQQQIPLLIYRG